MTPYDYDRQAVTYDRTRSASPSVVAPLLEALEGAPGFGLLDVGGGTGNYAAALRSHGWDVTVVDRNEPMLTQAAQKDLVTAVADATALPFPDATFDAVMLVSMIHHVDDQAAALSEARRVLKPGGRLALMGWTREHVDHVSWAPTYFPSTRSWMEAIHPPLGDYLAELPGARVIPVVYEDFEDLTCCALERNPEKMLDPDLRAQTSYFERLADTAPTELADGLRRLRADLDAGNDPRAAVEAGHREHGDASVLAWTKPAA